MGDWTSILCYAQPSADAFLKYKFEKINVLDFQDRFNNIQWNISNWHPNSDSQLIYIFDLKGLNFNFKRLYNKEIVML